MRGLRGRMPGGRETAMHRLACAALVLAAAAPARASDTVETWDVGATDVDFYVGHDGVAFGDIMLGYGVAPRLSAYLGTTLSDGETAIYLGVFGTPIDTDHFDLDLFLGMTNGGPGLSQFELAPAIELNLDLDPDMRSWGAYLRAHLPVHGRPTTDATAATMAADATYHVAPTVGVYRSLGERHQLLLEYSVDFHPDAVEVGGLAFGYNVAITDGLELINEIYVDIPQAGERVAFGATTGFIATIPR